SNPDRATPTEQPRPSNPDYYDYRTSTAKDSIKPMRKKARKLFFFFCRTLIFLQKQLNNEPRRFGEPAAKSNLDQSNRRRTWSDPGTV
ncbi:MAG: hypothetical protein ACI4RD_09885, partial [Kiritimatiellia bacterium]